MVLDAAHNGASIAALVETLDESFSARRRLLVFATTQEKDLRGMLRQLAGRFDHVIFTRYANNPRGVPPEELQALALELAGGGLSGVRHARRSLGRGSLLGEAGRLGLHHRLVFSCGRDLRRQVAARPFPL